MMKTEGSSDTQCQLLRSGAGFRGLDQLLLTHGHFDHVFDIPGLFSTLRLWLATGHTNMRRGFPSSTPLVQENLRRDPHAGDLYVFGAAAAT
jgi:ribonuclease BN (tRNA processing enzyme)